MHKTAHNKTGSQIPSRRNSTASQNAAAECRSTRSEEHTSELQSRGHIVCRLLLEKKKGQKSIDSAYPQWTIWQDFVRTQTAGAQARDGLKSTHPIEAKVSDPAEIEELFDEISYGKGASILRMIEAYIGPDNFQKGVVFFFKQSPSSNVYTLSLHDALPI